MDLFRDAFFLLQQQKDIIKKLQYTFASPVRRKMAHIEKVLSVEPIEGADKIELVRILGWQCVSEKGALKPGDLAVYIEIDSILPNTNPAFEFMAGRHYKVKTAKFLGTLSQGLALPVEQLLPYLFVKEGDDVTTLLGIKRPEEADGLQLGGENVGLFPTHLVPKTDELRIQSFPKVLDELEGEPYVITRKMDGCSVTVLPINGVVSVASRNYLKTGDKWWFPVEKYNLRMVIGDRNIAIQGELCGPGIQKNPMELPEIRWLVFDIYDIDAKKYYTPAELESFCSLYDLPTVPTLKYGPSFIKCSVDDLLWNMMFYISEAKWIGKEVEGIVIRHAENKVSPTLGKRLSFKVINNEY